MSGCDTEDDPRYLEDEMHFDLTPPVHETRALIVEIEELALMEKYAPYSITQIREYMYGTGWSEALPGESIISWAERTGYTRIPDGDYGNSGLDYRRRHNERKFRGYGKSISMEEEKLLRAQEQEFVKMFGSNPREWEQYERKKMAERKRAHHRGK